MPLLSHGTTMEAVSGDTLHRGRPTAGSGYFESGVYGGNASILSGAGACSILQVDAEECKTGMRTAGHKRTAGTEEPDRLAGECLACSHTPLYVGTVGYSRLDSWVQCSCDPSVAKSHTRTLRTIDFACHGQTTLDRLHGSQDTTHSVCTMYSIVLLDGTPFTSFAHAFTSVRERHS